MTGNDRKRAMHNEQYLVFLAILPNDDEDYYGDDDKDVDDDDDNDDDDDVDGDDDDVVPNLIVVNRQMNK